jgi:hypothetical protein
MKSKHIGIAFLTALLFVAGATAQAGLTAGDLKVLEGAEWVGTLTYLDYSSNKQTSIKSNVRFTPDKEGTWTAEYSFPDEPKANSRSAFTVSADGTMLNGQKIVGLGSKGDVLKIITTAEGMDSDKKAAFRFTYYVSRNTLIIRKQVKLEGTEKFFERNVYNWSRKTEAAPPAKKK